MKTLEELERKHQSGLRDIYEEIAEWESNKESTIQRAKEQLNLDRNALKRRQRALPDLKRSIELDTSRCDDLAKQIAGLLKKSAKQKPLQLQEEEARCRDKVAEKKIALEQEALTIQRLENDIKEWGVLGDAGLYEREMQPLYRVAVKRQRDYYKDGIDLADYLVGIGDTEASFVSERFSDQRIARVQALAQTRISAADLLELRRGFEGDRRMARAVLLTLVLKMSFSSSKFDLDSIPPKERDELDLLVEALAELWSKNISLGILIDGHADKHAYKGVGECISDSLNVKLSKNRAETAKRYLARTLKGGSRIHVDGYGNFALQSPTNEKIISDRRVELRIVSLDTLGNPVESGAHTKFFAMRSRTEFSGRGFRRQEGMWIEEPCLGRAAHPVGDLEQLLTRSGIKTTETTTVMLEEGRALDLRLGNAFIVQDGDLCVQVEPCEIPRKARRLVAFKEDS